MIAKITPGFFKGALRAVPSKSVAHRLFICAALAEGSSLIQISDINEDILATLNCLEALGAKIQKSDRGLYTVHPIITPNANATLSCGESGSTLRFLLPVAAALGSAFFEGKGRLGKRPLEALQSEMVRHGARFSSDTLPFSVSGPLSGGLYQIPGDQSSQFISGILLAAPLLDKPVRLEITGRLESVSYVDLTLSALNAFGIASSKTSQGYFAENQKGRSQGKYEVEGDWSSAAFPLVLGALCGETTLCGLKLNSCQGDKQIIPLLQEMGAILHTHNGNLTVSKPEYLKALDLDVSDIPDMVPALASLMMHARGRSRLFNASRLRLKESDRLVAVADMVNSLGGKATIENDSLIITGTQAASGGQVSGYGDHRIVMAASVAAAACKGPSLITDAQACAKSYPRFFEDFKALGGESCVVLLRE